MARALAHQKDRMWEPLLILRYVHRKDATQLQKSNKENTCFGGAYEGVGPSSFTSTYRERITEGCRLGVRPQLVHTHATASASAHYCYRMPRISELSAEGGSGQFAQNDELSSMTYLRLIRRAALTHN